MGTKGWTRKFRYENTKSSKFWEIAVAGTTVTTTWGRTGRRAQQSATQFRTGALAEEFAAQKIREKTRKGYVEKEHARLEQIGSRARVVGRKLRFVETSGGPLMLLPHEILRSWNGVFNAAGEFVFESEPCDYDRACQRRSGWISRIRVGAAAGLVLHSSGPVAWMPGKSGGVLVRWHGADSAEALAHAALTVPTSAWKRTRTRLQVGGSGRLILFDAARRGADFVTMRNNEVVEHGQRLGARLRLPEGTYAVDQIDSLQGVLLDGSTPTEFSTELTRLRRAS